MNEWENVERMNASANPNNVRFPRYSKPYVYYHIMGKQQSPAGRPLIILQFIWWEMAKSENTKLEGQMEFANTDGSFERSKKMNANFHLCSNSIITSIVELETMCKCNAKANWQIKVTSPVENGIEIEKKTFFTFMALLCQLELKKAVLSSFSNI